ncbi:relaxase/mobilization nuclease domain-containing protein [Tissierella praeacuta]|uniref:relaxase/mobilization nuclease domain-containing protein n=1 Tax=Tissierella praeacuta TaxID=43131 RepID=UPI001C124D1C|nr:relaxase/mobilization nuclease domain-containing protein [Tissierella praeacuta]MBU5257245.1 relaxase/mobilization nuclease domain-containing protein [Tissierella praeacuta]
MAITKIHPIKSTLSLAIDYITSDDKTDDQILISSEGCSPATAHLQFINTREVNDTRGTVLARHLIQSFVPGEVSPEKAHEIGLALAKEVLNGEYEYVLSTHVDCNHIHNHIIFNNVNWKTGKCYQSNKRSYHRIRYQSDKLCKENNLVVIDEYYEKYKKKCKTKGKSYKEYQERKKGSSWKGRLQFDIDRAIKKTKDWDDFLNLMKQYGYEIKNGKHISFKKIDGQQRFTRAMRIGENYTEERLKERILEGVGMKSKRTKAPFRPLDNVIDISANDKVKSSPGYKYWATKHNLSAMADTINQVRSEGFKTREQLEKALYEKATEVQNLLTENKKIEKLIEVKKKIMENRYIIEQYKEIYKYAKTHPEDKAFINEYSPQLILYKKAVTESFQDSDVVPTTKQIYEDFENLHTKKESLIEKLNQSRQEQDKLYKYKKNYDTYLGNEVER